MAAALTVDCRKTFPGRFTAAAQLTLPLDPPRVLILFGPSGSGKTTLLRCLAGLEWPEEGRIQFGSMTWVDAAANIRLSPQARRIGYMPQDYALFPTHTVAGNIEYGLSDLTTEARRERVRELIALLQLQGLEQTKPTQNCLVGNSNVWRLPVQSPDDRSSYYSMNPCLLWMFRHAVV